MQSNYVLSFAIYMHMTCCIYVDMNAAMHYSRNRLKKLFVRSKNSECLLQNLLYKNIWLSKFNELYIYLTNKVMIKVSVKFQKVEPLRNFLILPGLFFDAILRTRKATPTFTTPCWSTC